MGPFVQSTAEGPEVCQLIPDTGEAGKVPLKIRLHSRTHTPQRVMGNIKFALITRLWSMEAAK